jgi:hypothetical protein
MPSDYCSIVMSRRIAAVKTTSLSLVVREGPAANWALQLGNNVLLGPLGIAIHLF